MFIPSLLLFGLFLLMDPVVFSSEIKDLIPLKDMLEPEDKIIINGTAVANGKRAMVNLQSGDCKVYFTAQCDIALHFDMRQNWSGSNGIFRSYYVGSFKDIESYGGAPISANSPFCIEITIKKDHFLIHVNGNYFCTYKHRVSLDKINYIWLSGVNANHVDVLHAVKFGTDY